MVNDKQAIEDSIFYHNFENMKEEMKRYSKLEDMSNEDFRDTRRYSLLYGLPFSSCKEVWPFAKVFFCPSGQKRDFHAVFLLLAIFGVQ